MAIDTCIRTRGAPHSSLRCRRSVANDQRLHGGDLAIQGGAVRATQRGVADLAPGLERLAVVMQVAILDGDDLRHWRHFAEVLGLDPDAYAAPDDAVNPALGIVQIETLRMVNQRLPRYSCLLYTSPSPRDS